MNSVPWPVRDVVKLLELLQRRSTRSRTSLSVTIEEFTYGDTPMCHALNGHFLQLNRIVHAPSEPSYPSQTATGPIVTLTRFASKLHQECVTVASVYLTSGQDVARRFSYDQTPRSWKQGGWTLLIIASKSPACPYPIPVLISVGW